MAQSVEGTLRTLKLLQAVDDRLSELRQSVAGLSLRVDQHEKRVAQLNGQLRKKADELRNEEKDSAKKDLELRIIEEKIVKLKQQLTSIKANKPYAAMTAEISGHEAESSRAQDEAIAMMDRIEDTRSAMERIRKEIEEAEGSVRREQAVVADEVRGLTGQIRELTAERQGLVQQLDVSALDKYEKISRSRGGKAVVAVKDGVCQGCFMGVTRQTIARLWAKKELLRCPNCARIMYLEGEVQ
ncbi:MAG: hypothetical protein AMK75_00015 [Planctomycetes bacterium SM23_65]|nr:MAG: hypothetical protein AMK75_00015 [Planctomycetes bacterium SM23_65]